MQNIEAPKHKPVRKFLRVAGPITALVGLLFLAMGMISFFAAMANHHGPPKYFWCVFVGMPLLFVGIVLTKFGYLGSVVRYVAAETAPVAKDTVNYMAEGTRDSVKDLARAVTEGVQDARAAGEKENR